MCFVAHVRRTRTRRTITRRSRAPLPPPAPPGAQSRRWTLSVCARNTIARSGSQTGPKRRHHLPLAPPR
eukprot:148900-Prymnesium_polylepis.1